ncbi:hypothetical protein SBOR_3403 [Sclerotinia borealis F-4128]|uniref:Uncharacterized protein n=1 Tax=Sclerotinia borealis (strain F-4128) TaxID=1432307 RepID=W9CP22_SCLBF|nr:hypothetical protein SBOR_3403 [Sclerotinia borealis F-4128]
MVCLLRGLRKVVRDLFEQLSYALESTTMEKNVYVCRDCDPREDEVLGREIEVKSRVTYVPSVSKRRRGLWVKRVQIIRPWIKRSGVHHFWTVVSVCYGPVSNGKEERSPGTTDETTLSSQNFTLCSRTDQCQHPYTARMIDAEDVRWRANFMPSLSEPNSNTAKKLTLPASSPKVYAFDISSDEVIRHRLFILMNCPEVYDMMEIPREYMQVSWNARAKIHIEPYAVQVTHD